MKKLIVAVATAVAAVVAMPPADAGILLSQIQATPDPATTDDVVAISNVAGEENTCEGGVVRLFVEGEGSEVVFDDQFTPSATGDWSQSLGQLPAGLYSAEADCVTPAEESSRLPTRQPFFNYELIEFTVTQAAPTTTMTEDSTTSTTTAAAAAAATRPSFTG